MGTFTTSGAVAFKAGVNHSTALLEADWNREILNAESWICIECRADFSGAYAAIPQVYRGILGDVASSKAAIPVINFDISGYTSRGEAEDMININHDIAMRGLDILKDKKMQEKMGL